jgi:type III secretion protein C
MVRSLRPLRLRRLLVLLGAATVVFGSVPAMAEPIPFPQKPVDIVGRGQKVDVFLRELFGQAGLKTKLSPSISGTIQGRFTGKPGDIWSQMARAFNLLSYYDGSVVRIYTGAEIQSRTYSTAAPQEVLNEARRLRLIDTNNTVKVGSNTVMASGVPHFLENVEKLAGSMAPRAVAATSVPPVIKTVLPAGSDIVSPVGGAPRALPAGPQRDYGALRSTVVSRANARSPYEVRVFYLRYARADDTISEAQGRTVGTPGVASVLRGVMGDGCPSETVSTSGNFELARQSLPRLGGRGLASVPPGASQRDYDDYPAANEERGGGGGGRGGGCSRDVNGPRIELDPANNAVIVRDRPESMQVYEDMIASLDIEPRGIEIEATIIELDVNRLKELGLDFNFNFGAGLTRVFGGISLPTAGSFASPGIEANVVTGSRDAFGVRLNALERNGSARVVQRPRLSTLNNVTSVFDNQIEYFVRVAGDRQVDLFPIKVGMVMRVTPSVVYDGGELRTRLAIEIQDGSPSGFSVDNIPAIKRSSINTNAIIKQGESLLIGGISIEREFDSKQKIPGLGDVPLVGNAFKKRSKGGGRLERLFLITPRVTTQKDGAALAASQQQAPIPLDVLQRGVRKTRKTSGANQ